MVTNGSLALKINDLSFRYKGQSSPCIVNLKLDVNEGERFGLLGPNGAGKSTLMQLCTGLLFPEQGEIGLFGRTLSRKNIQDRKLFGYVPQDFSFYPELSPIENLSFFGAWYGMKKKEISENASEILEILGLTEVQNKQVRKFSGGMKRRVNLAIGVIHKPKLLFLDEPTVGVDVQTRTAIISYLKHLNREGTTLFYTSHQLKEAEELCDRIALIDEGKILISGELQHVLSSHREFDLEGIFLHLTGKAFRD